MRVYLATTIPGLLAWRNAGEADATTAFAVTPALRESYREGDLEELEWVAQQAAARASLAALADDPAARPRRVVLAVDVDDASLRRVDVAAEPSSVELLLPAPSRTWASVLLDHPVALDPVDAGVIEAAVDVVRRGGGEPADRDGRDRLDDADAIELGWWAIQELANLLADE